MIIRNRIKSLGQSAEAENELLAKNLNEIGVQEGKAGERKQETDRGKKSKEYF